MALLRPGRLDVLVRIGLPSDRVQQVPYIHMYTHTYTHKHTRIYIIGRPMYVNVYIYIDRWIDR